MKGRQTRMHGSPSGPSHAKTDQRDKAYYQWIGQRGGKRVKDRYGDAYFSTIGKKGGTTTKERYGTAHYREMGKRGGMARRQKG